MPKYHIFFSFSAALQRLQKIVTCFPEDKISYIYPDLQIQKVFTPHLLMHVFFPSGASVSVCTFCNSYIWVPQMSSVWKDASQNHSHFWKRFKYAEDAGKPKIVPELGVFLKNSRRFNCSGPTQDSWTTITKQKNTALDHAQY